jgi:YVTN family beta-propeller protein
MSMRLRVLAGLLLSATIAFATCRAADFNHPTGNTGIMMVDKIGSHVRFFDPKSFEQIGDVVTPARPHDFVFSPDHRLAYVTIYGDGIYGKNPNPGHQVIVVDTAEHRIVDTIDLAPYRAPHGIQMDAQGNLLISCDLDRKILVVEPKSHKIVKTLNSVGTDHWIALAPNGKKVYASNKNDEDFVTVVSTASGDPIGKISTPGGAQGISCSPNGRYVAIASFPNPSVFIVDTKSDAVTATVPLKGQTAGGFKPTFSPDGRWLIVITEVSDSIDVLKTSDFTGPQTFIKTGKDPMGVGFSPDGTKVIIANHGDGTVSVLDLATLSIQKTFHAGSGIETLSYF